MADRYWVGGTANWDGTAGTKWATTSGGGGGASVPTTADDVFFDASSTGTCTIATGNTGAKSINCTGFTGTITGTAAISVAGSITLVAGQTYTHTGTVTLTGTGTLTTAGKTFSGVTIDGVGITVTLGDALNTSSRSITVTRGTFTTSGSNYNVTAGSLVSNNSNTRTITLNGSTVTITGGGQTINLSTITNLTFNAGTSQITMQGGNISIQSGGLTFYNVSFSDVNGGVRSITGSNTFNNLSITSPGTGGTNAFFTLTGGTTQTVTGTFTSGSGSTVGSRVCIRSTVMGTAATISAATTTLSYTDFTWITGTGGGSWSGTSIGNGLGNTGITFSNAKTVYFNSTGATYGNGNQFALTSGGTGSNANYPLPQDTLIFDNAGSMPATLNLYSAIPLPNIDASARTNAATLNMTVFAGTDYFACGNVILGSGITCTNTGTIRFINTTSQTLSSNGVTFTTPIAIDSVTGTVSLGSNLLVNSTRTLTVTSGTFNANGYDVSTGLFASNNSNTRTITMGSGTWTLSGTGTVWNLATTTNLTFNKNTANIVLSDTSTTARTFAGGGLTYNNLTIGGATGTSTLTITGTNTFDTLASTKTVAHTIVFPNVTTTVTNWTITGTAGNVVTLTRTGASGTFTLAKSGGGVISGVDYLSISNSTASPTNTWYAGANSTNGGGNTNWLFTVAPVTVNSNFFFFM